MIRRDERGDLFSAADEFHMRTISATLLALTLFGDDPPPNIKSEPKKPAGCEIGAEVPAFYVREITSDRPNLAVCLVRKNGDRPAILISVRKIDSQVEQSLKAVDRTIDDHRADGLRGFAIFLPADSKDLKDLPARLTTLAHDRSLSLPLTIPVESANGPASLRLPEDAQTTVLFYVDKKIASRSFFKSGELTGEKVSQVVETAKRMAKSSGTATEK